MGACHRDLDGLAREGRDHLEFIDEAEINIVSNGTPADGRRMKDVGVVRGDRLGPRLAMETGNLLPEMIEHRVRRRMPIVPRSVHLAAGNHVDAGDFLLEDGRLRRAQLRVHRSPSPSWPKATRRSNASYHRGTLCAPTTVVVYRG